MESRKRDQALRKYLDKTVPYAKQDILKAIESGKLTPVWSRGVLKFKGTPAARQWLMNVINRVPISTKPHDFSPPQQR